MQTGDSERFGLISSFQSTDVLISLEIPCVWFDLGRRSFCHLAPCSGQRCCAGQSLFRSAVPCHLTLSLARISCWVGPWTLARTEPSNFQICLPLSHSELSKAGAFPGLELLPVDSASLPCPAGSDSHVTLNRAQMH